MPHIRFKQERLFYSIQEVSELFGVKQSLLRYWEKQFPSIKPARTDGGSRHYRREDVEEIRLILHLVKERGMTIAGARQKLKENREDVIHVSEIVGRLQQVREGLMMLKREFEELEEVFDYNSK
jgi:DNA-binding transcriptional MerR regulator